MDKRNTALAIANAAMWGFDLLYTVSPVDVIPDVIPVVGWMDDLLLLVWTIGFTIYTVRKLRGAPRGTRAQLAPQLFKNAPALPGPGLTEIDGE